MKRYSPLYTRVVQPLPLTKNGQLKKPTKPPPVSLARIQEQERKEKVHKNVVDNLSGQIGNYLKKYGKNANACINDLAIALYLGLANYYNNDEDPNTIGSKILDKLIIKLRVLMKEYPELDNVEDVSGEFDLSDGEGEEDPEPEDDTDDEMDSDEDGTDSEDDDELEEEDYPPMIV